MIGENGNLTIPEMSVTIGKSETTVGRAIQKLKEENIIIRVGSKKDG